MEKNSDSISGDGSFGTDAVSALSLPDLTEYALYEDGKWCVICDRSKATAWIRSDVTMSLSR